MNENNLSSSIFSGFPEKQNVRDFFLYRSKYEKKSQRKDFRHAMAQIDEYIGDPIVSIDCVLHAILH